MIVCVHAKTGRNHPNHEIELLVVPFQAKSKVLIFATILSLLRKPKLSDLKIIVQR